jgi:CHAT domain-containing protein
MRRVLYLLTIIICASLKTVAQTIENPVFERTNSHLFHIDKIELSNESTILYCTLVVPNNSWASISPQTYIEDVKSKKKYTIMKSEGIPFSPEERNFDIGMKCEVKLVFPVLTSTHSFNLIENPEGDGFNVYGVSLSNSFPRVYSSMDYERLLRMTQFWTSSGDFHKAVEYCKEKVEASKYMFGDFSILYISEMIQLSDLYLESGNIEESSYSKKIVAETCKKISHRLCTSESVQDNKYYLQDFNLFFEEMVAAFRFYCDNMKWKDAKEIITNTYSLMKENCDTSIYVPLAEYFIGYSSYYLKNEEDAEKYFLISYDSFQKSEEAKLFPAYGELLNMMSLLYSVRGDNNRAYKYAQESCEVARSKFGENSKEYGFALTLLSNAEMFLNMKQDGISHAEQASTLIEKAEDLPLEVKEIYRERIQTIRNLYDRSDYNQNNNDSANLSDNMPVENLKAYNDVLTGDIDAAIERLYNAKKYQEDHFETTELYNYVRTIVSLSDALSQKGRLTDADRVLDNAIAILQNKNVKSNLIRHIYASKGLLFYILKDFKSSIWWYKKAIELFREVDDRSISYATLLSNISLIYTSSGKYKDAIDNLNEAMKILDEFYSNDVKNISEYYTILNNIATNYLKMGDYDKGMEVYNTIISNASSHNNQRIKALTMCNMAEICILNNDFQKGRVLLEEALSLNADGYIKDMIDFNNIFCLLLEKNPDAINKLNDFNLNTIDKVIPIFSNFSDSEREALWNQMSRSAVLLNNWALSVFDTSDMCKAAYNTALFTKNMLVNSGRLLENAVRQSNSRTREKFLVMQQLKEELSHKGLSIDSINSRIRMISQLEKQIISDIPNFDEKLRQQFKSYNDVRCSLTDNDVAVEFIYLPDVTSVDKASLSYGALILKAKDDSPKFVRLCSEEELKELLCIDDSIKKVDLNTIYSTGNNSLYNMLWARIDPIISECSNVFYSPVGLINRINLSAISDGMKQLGDRYNLYEVSSTAIISQAEMSKIMKGTNVVIYGDVDYNEDIEKMEIFSQTYNTYTPGLLATRSIYRGNWEMLPGTKSEIDSISNLVSKSGLSVQVYSMDNANEESFKSLNGKPIEIVHIATHGFYFPDRETNQSFFFNNLGSYTNRDYSMLYSGLLFAGANNAWTGKEIGKGVEDGILTAEEISHIDLSKTNLVVLSACETGLGDVDKINGVIGLQRGFKRAGVKSILMSLWKVDDEATQILMVDFYKNLMNGKSKHQSLKDAQKYLRKVDNGKFDKPEYWASFILLDGID